MAVRAKPPEILQPVVVIYTVEVIQMEAYRLPAPFSQTALHTFILPSPLDQPFDHARTVNHPYSFNRSLLLLTTD